MRRRVLPTAWLSVAVSSFAACASAPHGPDRVEAAFARLREFAKNHLPIEWREWRQILRSLDESGDFECDKTGEEFERELFAGTGPGAAFECKAADARTRRELQVAIRGCPFLGLAHLYVRDGDDWIGSSADFFLPADPKRDVPHECEGRPFWREVARPPPPPPAEDVAPPAGE
jgi:hypothetical protein